MTSVFKTIVFLLLVSTIPLFGQSNPRLSIAPIAPANSPSDQDFLESLRHGLGMTFDVIEPEIGRMALGAFDELQPFNMDLTESRNLAEAAGGHTLMLFETALQPRTSLEGRTTYEAYASIFLVSGRTGRLVGWRLFSFNGGSETEVEKELLSASEEILKWVVMSLSEMEQADSKFVFERSAKLLEDFSNDSTRAPAPYRRLSPGYPEQARLYGKEGTVEVEIDLDAEGSIVASRVVRWSGFSLMESVLAAVQTMNWRPAFKDGKAVPARFLLRYNFAKITPQP